MWAGVLFSAPLFAADFDQLYIFGDSLTDAGAYVGRPDAGAGQRFTTDPGPTWVESLGAHFGVPVTANNPANPNTSASGNDFAQGGARVEDPQGIGQSASPLAAQPITTQVRTYFSAHPRGESDALYIVWGGANDVFAQSAAAGAGVPPDQISANLQAAAEKLNEQIQLLSQAGAGAIIVPTLPDIGQTPAAVMSAIQVVGNGNANLPTALGAATLALRAPATTPTEQQAVRDNAIATAAGVLGVPVEALAGAVAQVGGGFSQLSDGFNRALQFNLSRGTANVITLDMQGFFAEAIANPAAFGFGNVTGVACNTPSSLNCTSADLAAPGVDQSFLFADAVHPTTAGHARIMAYALSVLEAPGLISSLPQAPLSMGRGFLQGLQTQIDLAGDSRVGAWAPFAIAGFQSSDFTGDNGIGDWDVDSDTQTIGGAYRMDENWTYGLALSRLASDTSWGDRGGFDYRGVYGTVFTHYRNDDYFADLIGSFGSGSYDNVRRRTGFGVDPSGDTDGTHLLIAATGGVALWRNDALSIGPLFGLVYQEVDVDGYAEDNATGLRYSNQSIESLNAELGVFARFRLSSRMLLNASLVREQSLSDDTGSLSVRPVNLPDNGFELPGVEADSGLWRLGLSAGFSINKDVSATLDYFYRDGDDLVATHVLNLGIRISL